MLGFSALVEDPQFAHGRLILRLLRSLDFPVRRLLVVLNGARVAGAGPDGDPAWLPAARLLRPNLELLRPKMNLGCAGSWNEVVRAVPEAPYWLLGSDDVAFPPGTLQAVAAKEAVAAAAAAVYARDAHVESPSSPPCTQTDGFDG